jgi:DNA-binding NarL/FixJ family response regulator
LRVLQALADEGTVKGAALRLGIKRATVHKHLCTIARTLGARSTLHAVVIAMRRRLIH